MKTSIVLTMLHDIVEGAIDLGLDPELESEMMQKTIHAYSQAQEKEIIEREADESPNKRYRTP